MPSSGSEVLWQSFPRSIRPNDLLTDTVACFEHAASRIGSHENHLDSDGVLAELRPCLEALGYRVEAGKKKADKLLLPVLFGVNGRVERSFEADAFHSQMQTVLEVEAGRAVANYQFLKDLFQACMMQDAEHLIVAVRRDYRGSKDSDRVASFFETLFASQRLDLPLRTVAIVGY